MIKIKLDTVNERDMDLLFAQAILDSDFFHFVLQKFNIQDAKLLSVEISKTDPKLGESDITLIIQKENQKIGLLIEDKIDAIAMENQHGRYVVRGNLGIKNSDYDSFEVMIFCPKKYYEQNVEAKKYEHQLFYEECKAYFDSKNDGRTQIIEQAIHKSKSPYNPDINEIAHQFLLDYKAYQKEHYPTLDIRTADNTNGYWIELNTRLKNVYIIHKKDRGFMDLTFTNGSEQIGRLEKSLNWIKHKTNSYISVQKTGKAAAIRIEVPIIEPETKFDDLSEDTIRSIFDSAKILNDFANMIADIKELSQ